MKILIVDDNKDTNEMLTRLLTVKGHQCIGSTDGRNGLSLLAQKFDVVILDLTMPEFSGYDLLQQLQESKRLDQQKIVVLTASNLTHSQTQYLVNNGVYAILRKPVPMDVLIKTIDEEKQPHSQYGFP